MRRLAVALALLCSSCRSKHEIALVPVEATERPLTSVITTSDPLAAIQLLSGFHRIEQNSWRWTAARFAVALKVPPARPGSSVLLFLEANVPGTVLGRLGPVTVTASTSGSKLGSATWTVAGPQRFEAPLAPGRVPDVMAFEFSLDKFFPAGEVDERELGLVVRQVGLEIR